MVDRVDQQLGNYRLVRLLGKGSFAEVYLGQHVHINLQAAIKILHMQLAQNYQTEFKQEANTIALLRHPHIVRILDFGIENNTPYLIMDYAPYGTLRTHHPKGSIVEPEKVVAYVKQIASALQYAHDHQLIHRDLKPENLLIGENKEIVLSDFGLASIVHGTASMETGVFAGTIPYSAPEQILGKPRRESDQYSLGIIVYEWLSGDRPFRGTVTETISQHLGAPPRPLHEKVPGIPPGVEAVVMKALAKDPKQRFGSVQEFADRFEQACMLPQIRSRRWSDFWLRSSQQVQNALAVGSTKMLRASRITWNALVVGSTQILGTSRITWNELAKILGGTRITRRKVLAGLGLTGLVIAGGWLLFSTSHPQYLYKKSITIHHKNVRSNLSNFPILISLTASDLKTAANGGNVQNSKGYDIIFTDSTETITLDHEIEKYVPTTGEIAMWVRVPMLSASSDTVIYMHFGNSSISSSQENKTGVWDSNYKGVWHLSNGSTLTTNDSTSNGNTGTNHGASAATGQIDGAASFNSSSQYIQISNTINIKQFSISAWFKTSDGQQTSWRAIVSKNSGMGNRNFWLGLSGSNSATYCNYGSLLILYSVEGVVDAGHACTSSRMDDNNWHFATATYDGTTLKLYVDGSLSNTLSVSSPDTQSQATYIGIEKIEEAGFINPFTGTLDELRISNTARSADWIATEYNNQSSPSTFYTIHPTPTPSLTPTSTPLPSGKSLLYLFVRGTENKIWVDHFDGSTWSDESLVPGGFQTPSAPSVAQYGNMFYLFARGTDNGIYYNTFNSSSWSGWHPVPPGDGRTYDAPKATTYGNMLYLFNRGTANWIWVDSFNGSTWSGGSPVPGGFQTPSAPALAQYGNMLYLFARGNDNRIYFNTFNGSSWSGWNQVPDNGSTYDAPTATTYGNRLQLAVRNTSNGIDFNAFNGSAWSGWSVVPGNFQTLSAPSVAQYGNTLYLFVRGTDNRIYVNPFNVSSWSGWSRVPGNGLTPDALAAATYGVH